MEFWDKIAGLYDAAEFINGKVYREMLRTVRSLVPNGARVLDTAAGTGELSIAAAKRAASVHCTDISVEMLKTAQRKVRRLGLENITFEQRNIFDLSDEDDTYDVVMAGNVLHLLDNPERALNELYRVTKPGGLILMPTFLTKNKGKLVIKLYKMLGYRASADYTEKSLREMLKGARLGEIKTKTIDGMVPCCFAVMKKPE